jgi:hypothetical protein
MHMSHISFSYFLLLLLSLLFLQSVAYHNGWRWCSGNQSVAPPLVHQTDPPHWYLNNASKEDPAQLAAQQLLESFEVMRGVSLLFG